jgi:hypothetical protein
VPGTVPIVLLPRRPAIGRIKDRSLRIPEFLVARRRLPGTDMHASRRIPVEVVAVALCEYVVANDRPMSVTYGVVRQYLANG